MSEPESLDMDEPLAQRIERHWFDRLIMLSDGVFAIAMTLLALEVRPPAVWNGDLADLLAATWRSFFGYALGFFLVGMFWFANRSMVARLRRVDGPFSVLTLLFLALICLTPFATALMAEHGPARSMKVYAILVTATGIVQAVLWSYAAFWKPLLDPGISRRERWWTLAALALLPLWFGLVGLLAGTDAGLFVLFPIMVVVAFLGRARRRQLRTREIAERPDPS